MAGRCAIYWPLGVTVQDRFVCEGSSIVQDPIHFSHTLVADLSSLWRVRTAIGCCAWWRFGGGRRPARGPPLIPPPRPGLANAVRAGLVQALRPALLLAPEARRFRIIVVPTRCPLACCLHARELPRSSSKASCSRLKGSAHVVLLWML